MKQLSTILLILTIFLQTFSRFVIEADYFLNKSYIAKVLCINKEKPRMHCNGKCYLAKQLKEEQKKEQQAPVTKKAKIEVQLFNLSKAMQLSTFASDNSIEYMPTYVAVLSSFHPAIFHPPAV